MESALIISYSKKSIAFFSDMLIAVSCDNVTTVSACAEARRLLLERDFDLCIINAPLQDESGESLSRHIAAKRIGQVILAVKSEYYEEISERVEDYGVITVPKPINKQFFWNALKLCKAVLKNMRLMQNEDGRSVQKIEDIRVVDRAKSLLISYHGMTEPQAHKYLEKQAMDLRITKKAAAEKLLKIYEE
jgi:response regulator NasT